MVKGERTGNIASAVGRGQTGNVSKALLLRLWGRGAVWINDIVIAVIVHGNRRRNVPRVIHREAKQQVIKRARPRHGGALHSDPDRGNARGVKAPGAVHQEDKVPEALGIDLDFPGARRCRLHFAITAEDPGTVRRGLEWRQPLRFDQRSSQRMAV